MKDVSVLNEMIFSASTENELQEKFEDIYHRINNESEYDDSESVEFLPLPRLNSRSERSEVQDIISVVIKSGCFTSGPYIGKVEETLRLFYGAHTCIATSSGTDALKIALKSVGVEPGDEVIVPLNSFAATENAVMAVGAVCQRRMKWIASELQRQKPCYRSAFMAPACTLMPFTGLPAKPTFLLSWMQHSALVSGHSSATVICWR